MTAWTDGPGVASCAECGTPFAGMVCPNCRQRLEAVEVDRIAMVRPDDTVVVLAERSPDPVLEAAYDGPEVA
jgi:hypothetical protein